jgi:large subunit ribosomal protein L4
MLEVQVFTIEGREDGTFSLDEAVFGQEERPDLAHQVVCYQLAKRRAGTASTRDRSEIAGSTRKLFRQKGTGRARRGSIKSPLLRKGGVVFGPKPRDYSVKCPKKVRRKALSSVLSSKLRDGEMLLVRGFEFEKPRTKVVSQILTDLNLAGRSVLFITGNEEAMFASLRRSADNLPRLKTLKAAGANVYDLLKYDHVIVTVEGITDIQARFSA